jgi:hypothetical protein
MDDFGDIIYLLIVIGAVISGLIKKSRKVKPEANPRPVAEEPKEDWKEIFKQMIPEEQKPQPAYQAPQPAPKYQSYETATNYDDLRIKNRFATVVTDFEEETNEDTIDIMSEISLATPSDARTAFVYAEILTRKY